MSYVSATASGGQTTNTDAHLIRRISILLLVLFVELVLVRAWLNANSLEGTNSLTTILARRGPGTLRFAAIRFLVAFAMLSLVFGESQITTTVRRRLSKLAAGPISWRLAIAHVVAMALFGGVSWLLYGTQFPMAIDYTLTALWVITGFAAGAVMVAALVPRAFWRELAHALREVLTFAAVVSFGAFVLGRLALVLWQPLSRSTLLVAYWLLHPLVPALTVDPATFVMGTPDFQVLIMSECSGYEGLGLILVVTTAWLWFHRSEWRFPRALLLVPVGLVAMWFINCARVAALTYIGVTGAPEIAMGGFHSQAGWLGLIVVSLGICLTARNIPWLLDDRGCPGDRAAAESTVNPVAPFLVPFLAILGASMVAELASSGFQWLYPLRVVACLGALWYFRRSYRNLVWRPSLVAVLTGGMVFVLWVGLEGVIGGGITILPMPAALAATPEAARLSWVAFRILGAVITVPIAEELAFRGFLMRQFKAQPFDTVSWQAVSWVGVLISSLAFGLLHGDRWFVATIAGAIFGWVAIRRGSIGDAIMAHATTNALLALLVVVGGYWQFW